MKNNKKTYRIKIAAGQMLLKEYQSIGTVEECRTAMMRWRNGE